MKERLLRLDAVKSVTGLSRAAIYAKLDFPRSLKISTRAAAWREADVQRWIRERIADSVSKKP